MAQKTVKEVATEMLQNFTRKERKDGTKFYHTKNDIEWQKEIIFTSHGDKLPDDYVYEFIYEALIQLAEVAEEGSEEDAIYEIESDVYTNELTAWLHSRCDRVYYIEEAIQNGAKDGFAVLAMAQQTEKHEVAFAVLNGIRKYIENMKDKKKGVYMYKIIRFYKDGTQKLLEVGKTLEEAQDYCKLEESHGEDYFDGYTEE